ncbi:hypothetical protein R1flu_021533 [Riccia fluitans]|uniref:Uncharacterized protein n=1 Tax=Riccia fluitans TaxID=41844 RepID=A0ABD1ZR84_9MARC
MSLHTSAYTAQGDGERLIWRAGSCREVPGYGSTGIGHSDKKRGVGLTPCTLRTRKQSLSGFPMGKGTIRTSAFRRKVGRGLWKRTDEVETPKLGKCLTWRESLVLGYKFDGPLECSCGLRSRLGTHSGSTQGLKMLFALAQGGVLQIGGKVDDPLVANPAFLFVGPAHHFPAVDAFVILRFWPMHNPGPLLRCRYAQAVATIWAFQDPYVLFYVSVTGRSLARLFPTHALNPRFPCSFVAIPSSSSVPGSCQATSYRPHDFANPGGRVSLAER